MPRKPPTTTTQMIALWSAAVEKKVSGSIAPLLQRLVLREGGSLSALQADTLSHVLARALQIAAAKDGGVSAAIEYLDLEAGEVQAEPMTPSKR